MARLDPAYLFVAGQPGSVSAALLQLLDANGGVVGRDRALTVVSHDVLDRMAARGVVERAFPSVFVLAAVADDQVVRRLAALTYVEGGALSHLDALDNWRLPCEPADPSDTRVHITTTCDRGPSRADGIALHRRQCFTLGAPLTVVRDGCDVVRLEQAVVESWSLLSPAARRAPSIVAVRERRTSPARLLRALELQPKTAGAAQMRELFGKLAAGCHSELELWGHDEVFTHRSLPASQAQFAVRTAGRVCYLDRAYVEEMVGVELDGAAYHSTDAQREHDVRRDAFLAHLGWVVVRFRHRRLVSDPGGVRRELLAILAARRRQLRLPPR